MDTVDIASMLKDISFNKKQKRKEEKHQLDGIIQKDKDEYCTSGFDFSDNLLDMKCSDCKSCNIKEIDGFYVCNDCGLFNECIIDAGQEWRYYGAEDSKGTDQSRCDMPTSDILPKTSYGGLVGFGTKETLTTKRIRNMSYWNSIPYRESSLLETFNNITIMAQNSGIPQCIIEEAKYMYKKVTDIKSSRRTKKEGMKAGSVMLACKLKGVPRNCSEIAEIFRMKNNKTFRKSIKTFEEIWNNIQLAEKGVKPLKLSEFDSEDESDSDLEDDFEVKPLDHTITFRNNTPSPTVKGEGLTKKEVKETKILHEYITKLHRFSCILGMNDKAFEACRIILTHVETERYLDKHTPLSRTSAVIYYVNEKLGLNINKQMILQTCEISDVTINKCYQKLMKFRSELDNINILE